MTLGVSGVGSGSDKTQMFQLSDATRGAGLAGAATEKGVTSFGSLEEAEAALPEIRKRETQQGTSPDTDYAIVKNKETGRFEVHAVDQDLKALKNKDGAVVAPDLDKKHQFVELAIFDGDKSQTILAPGVTSKGPAEKKIPPPTQDPVKLKKDLPEYAIARVRNRPNGNVEAQEPFTVDQLKDPKTRDVFLKRCPQVPQGCTTLEANTLCGVSGTVAGMVASNPQSVVDLAKAMQKNPNHWLAKGIDSSLLTRLASGKISAADIQALSLAIMRNMMRQPGSVPKNGTNADNLMSLMAGMKDLGVTVPKLQLIRCADVADPTAMGHWMVVAPDAKPPVGINTWPNVKGEAEVFSGADASKKTMDRASSLGSSYRPVEVVTFQNGGEQAHLDIYGMSVKGQEQMEYSEVANGKKPLVSADYKRIPNSSTLNRSQLTYPVSGAVTPELVKETIKPPSTVGYGA